MHSLSPEKADWDIMDEQDTKYRCIVCTWTTNYVRSLCFGSDNQRRKNPQKYFYGELIAGKSTLGTPITLSGRVQAKHEY